MKKSEGKEKTIIKCKKCDFNSKSIHKVSSHNLMTDDWTIIKTSSNVQFVKKYLSTGTIGMSIWKSSARKFKQHFIKRNKSTWGFCQDP